MDIYKELKFKLNGDLRLHNYNNFIAFAFNYCKVQKCGDDLDQYYSALIIFSYANSTDNNSDLYQFLFNNYNSTIQDFSINLENDLKIENNIFGYIFSGIMIIDLKNCDNPSLISSKSNNIININDTLRKDETIKLEFNENNYSAFNCNLQYSHIITEPDLKEYDAYATFIEGKNETNDDFKKDTYIGKLTFFNIILSQSLINDCEDDNCDLCLENNKSFCIICKYNFNYDFITSRKECLENINENEEETDKIEEGMEINEQYSDINEENINTNKSYEYTNIITGNINKNSDKRTEIDFESYELFDKRDEISQKYEEEEIEINKGENYDENNLKSDIEIKTNIFTQNEFSVNTHIENEKTFIKTNTNIDVEAEISEILTENAKFDYDIEKIYLNESKLQLWKAIPKMINYIDARKHYEIYGEDYLMTIKPINSSSINSSTHVDFSMCENILRNHYNISKSRIITFLQIEIKNNNEKSLVNQVEYQVYDDNKTLLNLSLCNDENTNIEVFYSIKPNSSIVLSKLSSFKEIDIDLLNIKDKFFTDICIPYSDLGNDIILFDRIIDFYQNYSLCDIECMFNKLDMELKVISCNCSVKTNISIEDPSLKLEQLKDVEKSLTFEIIKCYNLVFSWKNKMKNIGFWIFFFLEILNIFLLIIYSIKGIKPIKKYIFNEMEKNGYIKKDFNSNAKNVLDKIKLSIQNKNIKRRNYKIKSLKMKNNLKLDKKENLTKIETNLESPPKRKSTKRLKNKVHKKSNKFIMPNELKISGFQNSSTNKIRVSEREVIHTLNNKDKKSKTKKIKSIKNKKKQENKPKANRTKKKSLSYKTTKGFQDLSKSKKYKNNKEKNEDNKIINMDLININLNFKKKREYTTQNSDFILNNYTFQEAIHNDLRSICKIFYIYLLTKQSIFHAFLFKSPLAPFPLRFCLLVFIISSDFALNAIFYFDEQISEKYRYKKNLFFFALSKNITIILLSTFIGFIFLTFFTKLSNSSNDIREVFRKEEEKIKQNKKYIVSDERKKEIIEEIEKILKIYKIKVVIFIIIEQILIIFFWYYVTAFCHVYNSTQKSWIIDSFLTMISRIIIDLLLCLGFAKLYRLAVESNCYSLYQISLFFYSFC